MNSAQPPISPVKPVSYTPGPWKVHENGRRANRYVAVIDSIPDRDGKVVANCICHIATSNPDCDANARVIAEAPATLESMTRILHFATGGCDMSPETRLKCIAKECEAALSKVV